MAKRELQPVLFEWYIVKRGTEYRSLCRAYTENDTFDKVSEYLIDNDMSLVEGPINSLDNASERLNYWRAK